MEQYIITINEESLFPEIEETEIMLVPAAYQCRDGMVLITQQCEWEEVKQFFFLNAEEDKEKRKALIRKLTQGREYKALDYCTFDCNSEDYETGSLEHDPSCRGVEVDLMSANSCAQMLEEGFVPPRNAKALVKSSYFSSYFPNESAFIQKNIEEVQKEINKLKNYEFFWIYEIGKIYTK